MLAVLVTLLLFTAWALIGAAALAALGADLRDLRVALSAPAFGTAIVVLPLVVLSNAGVGMRAASYPVGAVLIGGSIAILALRRPAIARTALPVVAVACLSFATFARPMFTDGFDWIANANGDMSFYVLAAVELLHHGLQTGIDRQALFQNHDFATAAQQLHLDGLRPGSQITLSALAGLSSTAPVILYMPLLISLQLCAACAAGSLAMQAARRWWAAYVAAGLLVISPLAAYGTLQQLMPQQWGLLLAMALLSWLMRPEVHRRPLARDVVVVAVLTTALIAVYVELAASLIVPYALYVAYLVLGRRVAVRALAVLWAAPLALTVVVLNTYLRREYGYLHGAASFGVSHGNATRLFGFALVPSAIPGLLGIRSLFAAPATRYMQPAIVIGAIALVAIFALAVWTARRGAAAGIVVLADFLLAAFLARNANDFGLFKLYMYAQPFLAAAVAVWLSWLAGRRLLIAGAAAVSLVALAQLPTLQVYVNRSLDPPDLRNASSGDVLPKFRSLIATTRSPVVAVTDNFTLIHLLGASAGDRRVYFVSRNLFGVPWPTRQFVLSPSRRATFQEDIGSARILSSRNCEVFLPTGTQLVLNRLSYPEGGPDFRDERCSALKDVLVFVVSSRGDSPTLPVNSKAVGMWQLEPDPIYARRTFVGMGRYALFQVLGLTGRVRVVLDYTTTPLQGHHDLYALPPAAVVGAKRVGFRVAGNGSARVISAPVRPQVINGRPYIALDMGRPPVLPVVPRSGLTGLWGRSVPLDPRYLTSYVRNISLIPAGPTHAPPWVVEHLPQDLQNPNLEYSGIYEDGWLSGRSYFDLAGGPASHVRLRVMVPASVPGQRLTMRVNGRVVLTKALQPGTASVSARVPRAAGPRRIDLSWSEARRLSPQDPRPAAALLEYLGIDHRTR